jgi:menaquinone-dependent protoporphyrinogen oxidase
MKILIAVASKHGSTREIADVIAEELGAQNLTSDLQEAGEVGQITGYDAVILGSAIYAGNWLPEAKRFAEQFQTELSKLPVWLFSSGPLGADNPKPHDDPARLAAPMGEVKIRDHKVFVGKLDAATLGFAERMIVKAVKAPTGDFRDWKAIRGWARSIATQLLAERAPTRP